MKLHHLGIATANIEKTLDKYNKIYTITSISDIIYDKIQDVDLCIFSTKEETTFELVCGKKIENYINKGIEIYHLCYETDNFDMTLKQLSEKRLMMISNPEPAVLFNNRKVVFFYTPTGLIEILEKTK